MKKFSLSGLRVRLILLVLLAVVPALGLIFYAAEEQRESTALEAQRNALRLARLVSGHQDGFIEGARQLLAALAQVPVVRGGDAAACREFLRALLGKYPRYTNLAVADLEGRQTCSAVPPKTPVNIADRPYFRGAMEKRDFAIGEYQIGRVTGRATINFAYPLLDSRGEMRGVVYAGLDLASLNRLAAGTQLPPRTTLTVIDRNGTVFVHYPEPDQWIGKTMPDGALRTAVKAQKGEGAADAAGLDGTERLYGFTPVGGASGATVIVGIAKDLALAPADRVMANSLALLVLVSLLALAGAWWGGNWLIVRQVKKLMEATEQLGTGDLAARVPVSDGEGELHQLARSFNRMAQGLQHRQVETKLAQDELQRLLRQSTALREINLAVTSTLDLRAVLNVLMEKIEVLLPYAVALVWLRDRETGEWERTACWNIDETDWKQRKVKGTPPIVKAAIENQSPVSVLDVPTDPRTLNPEFYRRHGVVSYLGVPLIVKGEALGVLAFLTRERHEFTAEEIEFLSSLAAQAAMAIHNSQLHEQSKRQAVELEKANRDLSRKEAIQALLKELSQDIASQDVGSLLKKLTDKVCEFFKVDIADVRIMENGVPRILGVSGIDEEEKMRLGRTGTGRGASGWIVQNRRPLMIPDLAKIKNPPIGRTTRRIGIHGYLAVPFFSRSGEVLGVLRALTYQPRDFLQEEIDLLQQMTNGAAIALENARLLEQITKQAAELIQANKVKNEFLGFVSHELRTPVNVIMGYAAILQSKMLGEINAEQDNALEKMSVNSKELLSMIEMLLEATKIEAGAAVAQMAELNLSDFLEELRSAYTVPVRKQIRLNWDWPQNLPVINTDGEKLRHILLNIIGNAVKYTEHGGVSVSARVAARNQELGIGAKRFVEFEIADTGIGIPKEELPRIFEMFSQVKGGGRSAGGVGLGLHIVKKFTELLGGDIHVASQEGKGSTFTITLPIGTEGHRPGDRDLRADGSPDAHGGADLDPPP
jgi:signal transduction histidine kinase